jgi:hypothetical protein
MRGALQSGFSMLIREINARSSLSIGGRPPSGRDFQRQGRMIVRTFRIAGHHNPAGSHNHPARDARALAQGPAFAATGVGGRAQGMADNGKELWKFNTGSGLRSGIVSYRVNGKQHILVPSGWGSWASTLFNNTFPALANVNAASSLIAFTVD